MIRLSSESIAMDKPISKEKIRGLWIHQQGLNSDAPFGKGKSGTLNAIKRLGYVQIDTIHVIERAHHHILQTRVPDYRPSFLHDLQSVEKSVFEFWTHALSFIPTDYLPHYLRLMRDHEKNPSQWYRGVTDAQLSTLLRRIKREGALSMRQIEEEKVEKDHEWASRKPSKRALQFLFYSGKLTISRREGMLKHYELTDRHFGWKKRPAAPSPTSTLGFRIDRALDAQGAISLTSASHLEQQPMRKALQKVLLKRLKSGELREVEVEGLKEKFYVRDSDLRSFKSPDFDRARILSPFDPLVIQRKRTRDLFDFDYLLECYVPAPKRVFGYFTLPILLGDEFIARIDLKADREKQKLLIQSWHWEKTFRDRRHGRKRIELELDRFYEFQFGIY